MSIRGCFQGKIDRGAVGARAGAAILQMLGEFEREHAQTLGPGAAAQRAGLDAADAAEKLAVRKLDQTRRTIIAQANALRSFKTYDDALGRLQAEGKAPVTLRGFTASPLFAAMRSLLTRDPWEIAGWQNVYYLARDIRGRAHARFAEAIDALRAKALGFRPETAKELSLLRALYGEAGDAEAGGHARAWTGIAEDLRQQFVDAGGALPEERNWRLPNPYLDPAKLAALGPQRFKDFVLTRLSREDMLDFETGSRLTDERLDALIDAAYRTVTENGYTEGAPNAAFRGRAMLANRRNHARLFMWKDPTAWLEAAENLGTHASPFQAMVDHMHNMADEIAMMRVMGPNPAATRRFILNLFDREAGRLAKQAEEGGRLAPTVRRNRSVATRAKIDRRLFDNLWAEVEGENKVPLASEIARGGAALRSWLVASQMGSAIVSSITDPALAMTVARFNGLPAMALLKRSIRELSAKGSEVQAAQTGMVADSLAHQIGEDDRVMGETIRTGTVMKLGPAVIKASGLRRWSAALRNAFGLEMMAMGAREAKNAHADLNPYFREALGRYGIDAGRWEDLRAAVPFRPQADAPLIRPVDIADRDLSERWARLINSEMDYAVIDQDPFSRSLLTGSSRPGTIGGEVRRAVGMYRMFPVTFLTMHFARTFARGWDGRRLSHGALAMLAMTAFGALALNTKQILQGRDAYDMDPSKPEGLKAWGAAVLQGGGLGVFGDLLAIDQTRYGQNWQTVLAGPAFSFSQDVLGDFLYKNLQLAVRGQPTDFLGDALYVGARYTPGSSLWFARLAFQRALVDQAALMIDPKTPARFRRLESEARKNWNQDYWWQPGELQPGR